MTVIWMDGNGYDGRGGLPVRPEFNLSNDIGAANVVLASAVKVWRVPAPTYRVTAVGYVELDAKVASYGEIGEYLVRQLVEWNEQHSGSIEFRALGDSPAIGLMLHPDCWTWVARPAPKFRYDESYDFSFGNRVIRTYDSIDARFIFEDLFAKLQAFARR
ncbi:hypothetical protein [Nonomuraea jabiensis]|uniref:hypothetical protein n=1 Tax=Nonomuraea jabiensis TaxID=882448 RepID=UPI003D742DE8